MRSLVAKSGLLGCPNQKSKIQNQHSSFVNLSVEASAKSDPASSKSRITDFFPMLFPRHHPSFETPKSPKERRPLGLGSHHRETQVRGFWKPPSPQIKNQKSSVNNRKSEIGNRSTRI
jgi:hypothetical protein